MKDIGSIILLVHRRVNIKNLNLIDFEYNIAYLYNKDSSISEFIIF
jgi:hypothetical protein